MPPVVPAGDLGKQAAGGKTALDAFARFARGVNRFVASPAATAAAFAVVLLWAACGPASHYSDGWQLVINTGTTIITFLMVFVLNNAQSRDTSAMNAKLDALIIALENADNRLVGLELKTEAESRAISSEIQASIAEPVAVEAEAASQETI
jgi:low affinity Fe/Cu permease